MAVGYPKNQASVDNIVGELAQSVNRNFRRAVQFKTELDSFSDAALIGVGYTQAEVNTLRAFATDLVQLNGIYSGASTLTTAKDFRVSLRPLWGVLGDF
ncbi:MAG TPA: hypothetical protein VIQ30_14105 [Pseudonocardia sp.]